MERDKAVKQIVELVEKIREEAAPLEGFSFRAQPLHAADGIADRAHTSIRHYAGAIEAIVIEAFSDATVQALAMDRALWKALALSCFPESSLDQRGDVLAMIDTTDGLTCDWGACNRQAIDARYSSKHGWLPVCEYHTTRTKGE